MGIELPPNLRPIVSVGSAELDVGAVSVVEVVEEVVEEAEGEIGMGVEL